MDNKNCVEVVWVVEGARKLTHYKTVELARKKFFVECLQETEYTVQLEMVAGMLYASFTMSTRNNRPQTITLDFDICLIMPGGRTNRSVERKVFKNGTGSSMVLLANKTQLLNENNKLFFGDSLKICIRLCPARYDLPNPVKLSLHSKEGDSEEDTFHAVRTGASSSVQTRDIGVNVDMNAKQASAVVSEDHLLSLSRDFSCLFDDKTISDFELCCEGVSFPVHKAVIYARSPVFKALLTTQMLETSQNSVDVPDFLPDTVRRFIHFLYTGTVPDMDNSAAIELYSIADKYAVLELRKYCSGVLVSGLSTTSLPGVLILSDRHSDIDLKEKVISFIAENENDVLRSPEWVSFMKENPLLALEVSHNMHLKRLGS